MPSGSKRKTMSLYAIGDFHLSLSGDKPMDKFGVEWINHAEKLKNGFSALTDEDTTVICGDLSWGLGIDECAEDFAFINSLPGRKIILKGNHDYWWNTVKKTGEFFAANGIDTIDILHNNCFHYGDYAICGTRGWFFEEETGGEHDKKILARETARLKASLDAAGDLKKLVFLHYPPVFGNYHCDEILKLLKDYEVRLCCYGHIHGKARGGAFNGWRDGTLFKLVSADYVNFTPQKLELY